MAKAEETSDLPYDPVMAALIIAESLRLVGLHEELAHHYRRRSTQRARIETLWVTIEGIERFLRANGVNL